VPTRRIVTGTFGFWDAVVVVPVAAGAATAATSYIFVREGEAGGCPRCLHCWRVRLHEWHRLRERGACLRGPLRRQRCGCNCGWRQPPWTSLLTIAAADADAASGVGTQPRRPPISTLGSGGYRHVAARRRRPSAVPCLLRPRSQLMTLRPRQDPITPSQRPAARCRRRQRPPPPRRPLSPPPLH